MNGFTVCVLLFGDYPDLASRCLRSIVQRADWDLVHDIRIGCNAVCSGTYRLIDEVAAKVPDDKPMTVYASKDNVCKYPMMREMFYGNARPTTTQYLMWFDDDSYIDPDAKPAWWGDVYRVAQQFDVTGAIYRIPPRGRQLQNIRRQPWYAGKDWPAGYRFRFVTGGWWVASTRFIKTHNYPFPQIVHNGGDVMLGELCYQQDGRIGSYLKHIHINAGQDGGNSTAVRRGVSMPPVFSAEGDVSASYSPPELSLYDPRLAADPAAPVDAPVPVPDAVSGPAVPAKRKLIQLDGF